MLHHSFEASDADIRNMLIETLKPIDYVTCIYGDHWWLAMVSQINVKKRISCVTSCIPMATLKIFIGHKDNVISTEHLTL